MQKHDASHLHYDFRLEIDGVLKSWAVPKGPSLDPARKALAVEVEDHPIEYGSFEGVIPAGQYGGGTVLLWDQGTWEPLGDPGEGHKAGKLHFVLHGEKLRGEWSLVRMHRRPGERRNNWLLMKINDTFADATRDVLAEESQSVKTGRSLEKIRGERDNVWNSEKVARNGHRRTVTWPAKMSPQLAVLVDHPPEGNQWLHEIKFDGYRLLAYVHGGDVRLMTRNDQDWTGKFPSVAHAIGKIDVESAIVDGEVVVLDAQGHSDFQALQAAIKDGEKAPFVFYAFDLLFHDGEDIRHTPLLERKQLLEKILNRSGASAVVRYSDHVAGKGESVIQKACGMALEGIVSKRADAPYVARRDPTWLKSKCTNQQEMVVVGFTDPEGKRAGFGSLLLGYHNQKHQLVYGGRVGTGFDGRLLRDLRNQLNSIAQKDSPLDLPAPPRERRAAHWVAPELVAEVRFSNWTRDGMLRHPAFLGLRKDKPAEEVKRETPVPARQKAKSKSAAPAQESPSGRLTHPDKVLYADAGVTKKDIADYYALVAPLMLPHVIDRPLTLLRCPAGVAAKFFYQRNWTDTVPESIKGTKAEGEAETPLAIRDMEGLLALVQINALEIHTWNCRQDDIEQPDQLVFDLDPGPGVTWKQIVSGAEMLHRALEDFSLPTFLKTSGGKGLHVTIPIKPNISWETGKSFCQQVALALVQQSDRFVANMRKDLRQGKIYVDYQRNGQSATAIAPYSTRARAGAAVSMPITWKEVAALKSADQFTVLNAGKHLARRKNDPWSDFEKSRVDLRRLAKEK